MLNLYSVAFLIALFVGVVFITDAVVGFLRAARGTDDEAVKRRLAQSGQGTFHSGSQTDILRKRSDAVKWLQLLPFGRAYTKLVVQSGISIAPDHALAIMAILFTIALAACLLVIPISFVLASVPLAAVAGVGPVLFVMLRARKARRRKFEESLPDAIDLMVRSLKIGHPMSGAMQVIAREMPDPIGAEFRIACDQVTYGHDVPTAFGEMMDRVGSSDMAYLAMAVQIQQESGGNLVESLSKLSTVIRDRFRMFRKVHAITAEGRFSAWMLSIFPFAIAGMLTLVKRDYYTQVADYPYFPHLVIACAVMLVINIVAMRVLTTLKV